MNNEERNAFVERRYDELRMEGKHGHYECLFRVVHEIVDAELAEIEQSCALSADADEQWIKGFDLDRDDTYAIVSELQIRAKHVERLQAELARVREELEIEKAKFPAIGSPLQKLGALLADLLDEDRFAQAEQFMLAEYADKERVARRAYRFGKSHEHYDEDHAVAQAMRECT